LVVGFIGGLIPPLTGQLGALVRSLPGTVDVQELVNQLRALVNTLPPETQTSVLGAVSGATAYLRDNASGLLQQALTLVVLGSVTVLDWLGFLLGFLAVPAFVFAFMRDQPAGVRAVNRALPSTVRQDFWALLRIVDRTLSSYLRGQLLRALVFGVAIASGLTWLKVQGFPGANYPLVFALFAGITYLIPTIGWLVGAIPAVLFALTQSRETAVAEIALYAGVAFLETQLLAPRVQNRSIDIHPAILMPSLVAASQVNLLLLILTAPLLVIARDLFRYIYGRLSDPAKPAGVLPGEQRWILPGSPAPAIRRSRLRSGPFRTTYPMPFDGTVRRQRD
jgi:predicted PurR-regulated permease PerM